MNNIEIRPMTIDDMDFVIAANKKVHESSTQTDEIIEFKKRLVNDILSDQPKAYVAIATIDEKPVGMALYSTVYFADEGQIMWLSNIFVKEEFRNMKVAKAVMKYLQEVSKEKGYYEICGAVDEDNILSKGFFNSVECNWLNDFKIFVVK